ncbi:ankyrin repeat domain-containing protein SOWAHC-like [Ixodes scapularis]
MLFLLQAADDDTTSLNTLDPRRREWILRAAQADYHSLVRLLREDPDLYRFETALHWAAKHGSSEMVKLIAGTHRLNPNVKSKNDEARAQFISLDSADDDEDRSL